MNKVILAVTAVLAVLVSYFSYNTAIVEGPVTVDTKETSDDTQTAKTSKRPVSNGNLSSDSSSTDNELSDDEAFKRRLIVNRSSSFKGLTSAEIQEIGEKFKNEKDKKLRREYFEQLLTGMTEDNALEIRKFVEDLSERSREFREFHKMYGAVAGAVAVNNGTETKKRDVEVTLEGWAQANPEAALKWFNELDPEVKDSMMSQKRLAHALLEGIAENDTAYATQLLIGMNLQGGEYWRSVDSIGDEVWDNARNSGDPKQALFWAEELPDGDIKKFAIMQIARKYARVDPVEAAEWLETTSQTNNHAIGMVVDSWRRKDAAAAANWLSSFDGQDKDLRGSYYSTFSSWAEKDFESASNYLNSISDPKNQDYAKYGMTRTISTKKPQEALDMASSINDPKLRIRSVIDTSRNAFKDNPEKLVDWLNESKLSPKEQETVLTSFYKSEKRKR